MSERANPLTTGLKLLLCLAVLSPALLGLNPHKTLAQYTHSVWTQSQGLPQDSVRSIAQTADDFLWISTNEGLARFDGYDFTTFTKENSDLPSNSVGVIAAGSDHTLWIATPEGLTRYHKGQFTTFTTRNGLPSNHISALLEDNAGALWVIAGSFLTRFDHGKFTNYSSDRLLPVRVPRSLYEDAGNTLWLAGEGGVGKLDHGTFVPVLGPREMNGQIGITMVEDRNGSLWIGGVAGIIVRKPDGTLTRFDSRQGLPDNLVMTLWADRSGNLWAGTNSGLSRLEGNRFVRSDFENARNHDFVRCVFEDREGDLWVGTKSGLHRFRDDLFTVFGSAEGFPGDDPVAVHQDRTGSIWVGYHGSGLAVLENGRIRVYTSREGLASDSINAIREARNGDLLIATRGGLSRMHAGRFYNYILPDAGGAAPMLDVLEDGDGSIWAAAAVGIYKLTGSQFMNVIPAGPLLNGTPDVLAAGLEGVIWVGTDGGGVRQIKNGKISSFSLSEGLGSEATRSLYQDPDGTLWIGTLGGGLTAFRSGTFARYTARDGLLSDNISHIEDDGHGSLWLSTHRGICRVRRQQLRDLSAGRVRALTPVNYGVEDGLRSSQVAPGYPTGGGGTRTGDGRLWFPTTKGLAVVDPAAERAAPLPAPALEFIEMTVDGRDLDIRNTVKLKPGPRQIQFRYTAIHLNNPEHVRYEYFLEGLDPDWIPAANRRVVHYTSLPHGRYRLRVRASLPEHSPSEASFDFEVLPYFYQNPGFILIFIASALASIYGIYQLRLRQIRLRFSLVLEERARMAREIHDTLSQGLVGISSQLNAVAGRMRANDGVAEQHLELARKMVRHSLTEARRSLMDLRVPLLDDLDLPSALNVALDQWISGSGMHVGIEFSGGRCDFPQDVEQNIFRIAREAIANAAKHGDATQALIHFQTDARTLVLTITDNGRGFDSSCAFSMTDGHFGLLGMRERAERLGGDFDFSSQPGRGTCVKVIIPMRQEQAKRVSWRGLLDLFRMRPARS
jgi:signal transduction histidine kinase/ligand-binding sensor domain-containing protein